MAIVTGKRGGHSDRSAWDRKRHRQLVEESIKKNLSDIIADESIIGQSKDKKIKIPIRSMKEYQFIYGKNSGAGSGTGEEKKGQIVGKANQSGKPDSEGQAGNSPGEDIYETEITIEELVNYLFEDLKLPDLERKKLSFVESERKTRRTGYQLKGIPPRLAKKRTVIEKLKRSQSIKRSRMELDEFHRDAPLEERLPFREDDLRYHRMKEDFDYHSNAVIICIMDISGSMDQTKKYLARSFYFLLYQFVRYKYEHVEVVFVAHTTEAKEVNEQEFFQRGESGGTLISSGYAKALEIIDQRYNPANWNVYVFHSSDGDNWAEDNQKAVALAQKLCDVCNLFGYGEINPSYQRDNTIRQLYQNQVKASNFVIATMSRKEDIWPAFRKILEKETAAGGDQ